MLRSTTSAGCGDHDQRAAEVSAADVRPAICPAFLCLLGRERPSPAPSGLQPWLASCTAHKGPACVGSLCSVPASCTAGAAPTLCHAWAAASVDCCEHLDMFWGPGQLSHMLATPTWLHSHGLKSACVLEQGRDKFNHSIIQPVTLITYIINQNSPDTATDTAGALLRLPRLWTCWRCPGRTSSASWGPCRTCWPPTPPNTPPSRLPARSSRCAGPGTSLRIGG